MILLLPPAAKVLSSKAKLGSLEPQGPVVTGPVGSVTLEGLEPLGEQAAGAEAALMLLVAQKGEQVAS